MTLWEFACCMAGYTKAHSSEDDAPPAMSDDMARELGIDGF